MQKLKSFSYHLSKPKKVIFGLIVALGIFRVFLPTIVLMYVNRQLDQMETYQGHVDDIQ